MRFCLLADLHLTSDRNRSLGIDTIQNFERALARVKTLNPDQIVLLGDYSLREPQLEDVEYLCAKIEQTGIDYSMLAGNHDDPSHILTRGKSSVNRSCDSSYFRLEYDQITAIYLDTSKAALDETQLIWLTRNLENTRKKVLLFMHHPPIHMGVPFMDNQYAFKDIGSRLYQILFSHKKPISIFCGHYHTARSTQLGCHSIHLCPSTYFQLKPDLEEFTIAHAMPGIRTIEVLGDQIRTSVEFLRVH